MHVEAAPAFLSLAVGDAADLYALDADVPVGGGPAHEVAGPLRHLRAHEPGLTRAAPRAFQHQGTSARDPPQAMAIQRDRRPDNSPHLQCPGGRARGTERSTSATLPVSFWQRSGSGLRGWGRRQPYFWSAEERGWLVRFFGGGFLAFTKAMMGTAAARVMAAPQAMAMVKPWTVPVAVVADGCAVR